MSFVEEDFGFTLRSTDPRGAPTGIKIKADQETREEWVKMITSILQTQKDFLKAIQSPIAYQKELTRDASVWVHLANIIPDKPCITYINH